MEDFVPQTTRAYPAIILEVKPVTPCSR